MAANNKMKGLLKGLRYISQIFDDEDQQPEMQIGLPTDVKHVAHIGADGPSVNSNAPSWMNEFKSAAPGAPNLANGGEGAKSISQDKPEVGKSSKRSSSTNVNGTRDSSLKEKRDNISQIQTSSSTTDKPEQPKSSRRTSSANGTDPPLKEKRDKNSQSTQSSSFSDMPEQPKSSKRSSSTNVKSRVEGTKEKRDKPKHSKKPSKNSSSDTVSKPKKAPKDPSETTESNSEDLPKKSSRRKKTKDGAVSGTTKRNQTQDLDSGSEFGSESRDGSGFEDGEEGTRET
ncbi:hypothetical protein Gotri_013357 [Gossypium trilobum]|uniref:CRIB domain-containing protein n=1 Tax=Gossypium trilobum TaxID=34281 RepID=A0A7J9DTL3_9ROSI|nr:hypothetical protein [Gossypium trilobum]